MNSSTRTASGGGNWPLERKRRTLVYDAVSTSAPNVESGFARVDSNRFGSMGAYSAVDGAGHVR